MNTQKNAVLLINLGSPDAPTAPAIARYLGEFLSDRRVVDIPKLLWQPILRGIILRIRPKKLVPLYEMIWDKNVAPENGAPLKAITLAQAEALSARLATTNTAVYWAMRYQNPSIASVLERMANDGVTDVTVLPLYPQYSRTTTETAFDAIASALNQIHKQRGNSRRSEPLFKLHTIQEYHAHPMYIAALAQSVRAYWQAHGQPNFAAGDKLLLSFHGLPERNIKKGDPYQNQCEATHRLLTQALNLNSEQVLIAYQSRFGKQKWIEPYTQATLEQLAKTGTKRVDVMCPGFAADCLETLEEIAHQLKAVFLESGGKDYHYIACLNTQPAHIEMMAQLVAEPRNHA
jgi:ferrochelatase